MTGVHLSHLENREKRGKGEEQKKKQKTKKRETKIESKELVTEPQLFPALFAGPAVWWKGHPTNFKPLDEL